MVAGLIPRLLAARIGVVVAQRFVPDVNFNVAMCSVNKKMAA